MKWSTIASEKTTQDNYIPDKYRLISNFLKQNYRNANR